MFYICPDFITFLHCCMIRFIIQYFLLAQVQEDDIKPKQICASCISKLNLYSGLIDSCIAADQKFEVLIQKAYSSTSCYPMQIQVTNLSKFHLILKILEEEILLRFFLFSLRNKPKNYGTALRWVSSPGKNFIKVDHPLPFIHANFLTHS